MTRPPGRPPKSDVSRTLILRIRLTPDELKRLKATARAAKRSVSSYARLLLLGVDDDGPRR